jgi:hypothetical protein
MRGARPQGVYNTMVNNSLTASSRCLSLCLGVMTGNERSVDGSHVSTWIIEPGRQWFAGLSHPILKDWWEWL